MIFVTSGAALTWYDLLNIRSPSTHCLQSLCSEMSPLVAVSSMLLEEEGGRGPWASIWPAHLLSPSLLLWRKKGHVQTQTCSSFTHVYLCWKPPARWELVQIYLYSKPSDNVSRGAVQFWDCYFIVYNWDCYFIGCNHECTGWKLRPI